MEVEIVVFTIDDCGKNEDFINSVSQKNIITDDVTFLSYGIRGLYTIVVGRRPSNGSIATDERVSYVDASYLPDLVEGKYIGGPILVIVSGITCPLFEAFSRISNNYRFVSKSKKEEFFNIDEEEIEYNYEEKAYLDLMQEILDRGEKRGDRTGVGTFSIFGANLSFNLRNGKFPLLTTKKIYWQHVVNELKWFLSGSTDAKVLDKMGTRIWNDNTSREFLDERGLKSYEVGDLGPMYGHALRSFGASYKGCGNPAFQRGEGFDQITRLLQNLKKDPLSRRHLLTTYDPSKMDDSVLAPCHGLTIQFYVSNNELSCQVYCRSSDCFLGLPWNIASYALLTAYLAHLVGLGTGDLRMCLGDAHIYSNHVSAVKEQLRRVPKEFPSMNVQSSDPEKLEKFDVSISGYEPYPSIFAKMAI